MLFKIINNTLKIILTKFNINIVITITITLNNSQHPYLYIFIYQKINKNIMYFYKRRKLSEIIK